MDTIEIFQGRRIVKEFGVFTKSKGKVSLDCKVEEEWKQRYSGTSACGIPIKLNFKRTVGVSLTERESLESTVSGKFGLKDVWEIGSSIKGNIGYDLRLDETVEEAKALEAPTPPCGRLTIKVFQLHRLYTFTYKDRRFLRRKKAVHSMVEKLNEWWDYPDKLDPAPECQCRNERVDGIKSMLGVVFKRFGIHVECLQTAEALTIPSLGLSFPGKKPEDLIGKNLTITGENLPSYMLFLANESSHNLAGVVVPYREAPVEEQSISLDTGTVSPRRIIGVSILAGVGFILARLARRAARENLERSEESAGQEATDRLEAMQGVGVSESRSGADREGPTAHA